MRQMFKNSLQLSHFQVWHDGESLINSTLRLHVNEGKFRGSGRGRKQLNCGDDAHQGQTLAVNEASVLL